MTLESLIAQYGLWGIGLGAGFEGETVAVLGGITVHRGVLPYFPAVMAAFIGSFLADQLFFLLGRYFGGIAYVRRVRQKPAFGRAVAAFEGHPTIYVFAFRFLYGLRTISPLAIGMTSISAMRFVVLNAAAALIWATTFITIGYIFGQAIEATLGRMRALENLLVPAAILVGLLLAVVHRVVKGCQRAELD